MIGVRKEGTSAVSEAGPEHLAGVVRVGVEGGRPPYVPWVFGFTLEAHQTLVEHYGTTDLEPVLQNHFLSLGNPIGFFTDIGQDCVQDVFGVVWDRSVDKDIGIVKGRVLPEPTLEGDVPLANMLAFIEAVHQQPGFAA